MESIDPSFEDYVRSLVNTHKGTRIYCFEYQNRRFWLKQPEHLSLIWKLLKPNPKKSFQQEIETLQYFESVQAPVPQVMLYDEDFLVLDDAGRTAINWKEDPEVSDSVKRTILSDCTKALIDLHHKGLIHGRPALRDIAWRNGEVTFLDFEAHVYHKDNLVGDKARDVLIFLHGLCRAKVISDHEVQNVIGLYTALGDPQVWQRVCTILRRYRFVYYLLLPFKPIAKTDLIAIYRLFDNMSAQLNKGK
ncbi:protein kinase family protein [Pasteurella sp. P03HT]